MKLPERRWVRHTRTGQRGYLVEHGGKIAVRLDRGADRTLLAYRAPDWEDDIGKLSLQPQQIARLCFVVDAELCKILNIPFAKQREWLNLSQEQRMRWVKAAPAGGTRGKLYEAVKQSLTGVAVERDG